MSRLFVVVLLLTWPTQFDLGPYGSIGCAPTAVSYLTRYYARPISARALLEANLSHLVPGAGLSPSYLADDLPGFSSAEFRGRVPAYPFLAAVLMHGGYHSIAVTYATPQVVLFLDPWDGQPHTLTWQELYALWPCRCGLIIRPQG